MTHMVSKTARIGKNVSIGAYSVIGDNVEVGDDTHIGHHVVIDGHTRIGSRCRVHPFSVIGGDPQHKKHDSIVTPALIIGDNCTFREHVTVNTGSSFGNEIQMHDREHGGTSKKRATTRIGSNCLFLAGSHVGHDCKIGDDVVISNGSLLAGHVCVGDGATVGGMATIRQFVNVGSWSMIGGSTAVDGHVAPYGLVSDNRARFRGPNLVGLRRRNISLSTIRILQGIFQQLLGRMSMNGMKDSVCPTMSERARSILQNHRGNKYVEDVCNFLLHKDISMYDWGAKQQKIGFIRTSFNDR
mmetsp:Transcript_16035/g.19061  ORF Transcript_16035/g.19061 Transcript_16035/m.19061 type:complete len:299 (+) Transcript_16035:173-1069(+)